MCTSFLVVSVTISRHTPAHLKQLSHATTTISHHDTHTHLRALIKSSHPMYFQFTHHVRQHNMFSYLTVKATLLRHITKTFLYPHTFQHQCTPHQTTHRINSYRTIKTSEFFSTSFSFAMNFNPYQYIFLHIYTHAQHRPSLNRLIHKIPSEQPGQIEASHMGCPQGLAFRRTSQARNAASTTSCDNTKHC
jgi:hypothetical protein